MASASSDVTLTSSNGTAYTLNAYFNENSTSVANNTSNITVRATLSSGSRHWSSSYTSYLRIYWHDNRNNTDVFVAEIGATSIANNSSITAQGTINVTHHNDGSLSGYAYATWTMGGTSAYCPQSGSVSNGWTALTSIPRFASITNSPSSLNDESSFWFSYSNPANASMSCWLEVNPTGDHVAVRSLSGTSGTYTWTLTEAERNQLRSAMSTSNSGKIRIGLYSTIGGTRNASYVDKTFTIINATPIFEDFSFRDTNTTVTAVTGNDQVLVKGLSTLQATITSANKMTALKQATPKNYIATIDNINSSANYSENDLDIDVGIIPTSGVKRLNVRAYDSRNNSVLVYKDVTVYDYDKPIINTTAERLNNFENTTTLKINGSFSSLIVDSLEKNTIQTIQYRYRETSGTWENWTSITPTIVDNSFSCSNVILTLDNTKSFEIEVQVIDNLQTNTVTLLIDVGEAVFFISSNQRKCYINNVEVATIDYVKGNVLYDNSTGARNITLSDNASNYDYFEIYDTTYKCHKVYSPNGRSLDLSYLYMYTPSSNTFRNFCSRCTISGTTITLSNGYFYDNGGYSQANDSFVIKRVIGYKY